MNEATKNLREGHVELLAELKRREHQLVDDPFGFDNFVRASCQPVAGSVVRGSQPARASVATPRAEEPSCGPEWDWLLDAIGKAMGDSAFEERQAVRAVVAPLLERIEALEKRLASLETSRAVEIRRAAEPIDLPALPLRIAHVA
jgi:hypothetical protein